MMLEFHQITIATFRTNKGKKKLNNIIIYYFYPPLYRLTCKYLCYLEVNKDNNKRLLVIEMEKTFFLMFLAPLPY